MTRQGLEDQARARWDELVKMGGEQAADDARDQAGLPEVFVWHRLKIPELHRLIIACKVRIMEVQSAFSANGSRAMDGTWAFTRDRHRVWVPEKQFDRQPPGATIEPLRGYGHTMAVMQNGECLGWITVDEGVARGMNTNGKGIYDETGAGKHDMVLHQDHRGSWRIDLVTSKSGNHTDVTGPNRGYGSAEEAFQAALDVQRTRGIRGKSHVYIADRDGNLSDYEPMEANGHSTRWVSHGESEDDYVIRDGGLWRVGRSGTLLPILTGRASQPMSELKNAMEADARDIGVHAAAVFQQNHDGGLTQIGNVVNGKYQESGAYSANARGAADRDGNLSDYVPAEANANGRMHPRSGALGPSPKFRAGQRVIRDDGSARGEVAIVGNYDETIGGYRYKVQQDGGGRIYWNESSMRAEEHSPNARGAALDEHAATELSLYIENDYALIGAENSKGKSIDANLRKKVAQGKYDSTLAVKLWEYLIEDGARKYAKEFSVGSDWAKTFSPATRRKVAQDFAKAWEQENLGGQ